MEFLQYLCLIFQRKIIAKTAKEGWKIQPAYRTGLSMYWQPLKKVDEKLGLFLFHEFSETSQPQTTLY